MCAVSSGRTIAALSAYYTRAEKRLATAKTMGLSIPEAFLVRADEVVRWSTEVNLATPPRAPGAPPRSPGSST